MWAERNNEALGLNFFKKYTCLAPLNTKYNRCTENALYYLLAVVDGGFCSWIWSLKTKHGPWLSFDTSKIIEDVNGNNQTIFIAIIDDSNTKYTHTHIYPHKQVQKHQRCWTEAFCPAWHMPAIRVLKYSWISAKSCRDNNNRCARFLASNKFHSSHTHTHINGEFDACVKDCDERILDVWTYYHSFILSPFVYMRRAQPCRDGILFILFSV